MPVALPSEPTLPVLSREALNRATLARQHLLHRGRLDVVDAAAAVGGLQAQEPASPYLALWTRLEGFDAAEMTRAFQERRLVKAGLMRATLHAVPAADYLALRPAVEPAFSASSRLMRGLRPDAERLASLRAEIEALAATPRPNNELRDRLAELEGVDDPEAREALWWWVRRTTPLIQAPSGGPWSFGRRPLMVAPEAWLGAPFGTEADGLVLLVRRHLAALGPATVADVAAWSRLAVARLRPAIEGLDAGGELWHGRDEHGRELLDLVDAPRPGPDVEAPPRLLPMWDGLVLGHADRTRVISDEDRAQGRRRQRRHVPVVPGRRARRRPVVDAGHRRRTGDRDRAVPPARAGRAGCARGRGRLARRLPRRPGAARLRSISGVARPQAGQLTAPAEHEPGPLTGGTGTTCGWRVHAPHPSITGDLHAGPATRPFGLGGRAFDTLV